MPNITDEAVECIKVIVDNNRCETCDSIDGDRARYQCGHSFCDDCVAKVEHCPLCLTPPDGVTKTPFTDSPAERRASNAAKLLKIFEETFGVDVYKRSRISEQLKIEKQLFPDCIQAPVKYHNKRKSSILQSDKENRRPSFFPGEVISPVKAVKMENARNYVQLWLDNNQKETPKKSPRKPLADLTPTILKRRIPTRADIILEKVKAISENTQRKKRKLSSINPALAESQPLLNTYLKTVNKEKQFANIRRDFDGSPTANVTKILNKTDKVKQFTSIKRGFEESLKTNKTKALNKTDKDESGIVIDDNDDLIVIDDSQSQVDKDKLAWLAVLEANEKSPYVSQSIEKCSVDFKNTHVVDAPTLDNQPTPSIKVPFYKRSYLEETCDLCKDTKSDVIKKIDVAGQLKDVSITIENSTFITTIKMSTVQDKPIFEKHSASVQTDTCILSIPDLRVESAIVTDTVNAPLAKEITVSSQDLFTAEMKIVDDHFGKQTVNESPQLILEESDSDDAANESSIIQVTAEIHHSSEQFEPAVLTELEQSEIQHRSKRSGRGHTPNSTDSSDKENFDPNRKKRMEYAKKDAKKRKRYN